VTGFIDTLAELTRTLVTIVFLAAVLELLLPSAAARRLARVVVGLLLILTVLGPIGKMIHAQVWVPALSWREQGVQAVSGVSLWPGAAAPAQRDRRHALSLFRQSLEERAVRLAASVPGVEAAQATAIIDVDEESTSFGTLLRLEVVIRPRQEGETGGGIAPGAAGAGQAIALEPVQIQVGPVEMEPSPRENPAVPSATGTGTSGTGTLGETISPGLMALVTEVRRTLATGLGIPESMIVVRVGP